MTISVRCQCGALFQVRDEYAGKKGQCPTCGNLVVIPPKGTPVPPPDPQLSVGEEYPHIETEPVATALAPRSSGRNSWWVGLGQGFLGLTRQTGVTLLLVGLVSVVLARGCEITADRSIARANAQYSLVQNEFNDEWAEKKLPIEAEIDNLEEQKETLQEEMDDLREERDDPDRRKENRDYADLIDKKQESYDKLVEQQNEKQEELTDMEKDQARARRKLQRGDWQEYQADVRDARAETQASSWSRAWLFLLGTVILAVGLMTVAFTGEGAERTICMLMIAILTFSLYVGGMAWFEELFVAMAAQRG